MFDSVHFKGVVTGVSSAASWVVGGAESEEEAGRSGRSERGTCVSPHINDSHDLSGPNLPQVPKENTLRHNKHILLIAGRFLLLVLLVGANTLCANIHFDFFLNHYFELFLPIFTLISPLIAAPQC